MNSITLSSVTHICVFLSLRAFLTTVVVASENNENQALSKEVLRFVVTVRITIDLNSCLQLPEVLSGL